MAAIDRFLARIQIQDNGCWKWLGVIQNRGYGTFQVGGEPGKMAHRWSYENFVGPIPDGMTLDHKCHNGTGCKLHTACPHRRCVNPWHLEPMTGRENTLRGEGPTAKNAAKTHCKYGHPFGERKTKRHKRKCEQCNAAQKRRFYRKHRERILAARKISYREKHP